MGNNYTLNEKQTNQFNEAISLYNNKEYPKAHDIFLILVELGHIDSMYYLGMMKRYGLGIKENQIEAHHLFIKAGNHGHTNSSYENGLTYLGAFKDARIEIDYEKSLDWFSDAALNEHPLAQHHLALFYEEGIIVDRNMELAMQWHEKLANNGIAESLVELGLYYQHQAFDNESALEWYLKAYTQGVTSVSEYIGSIYEEFGDYNKALYWYQKDIELIPLTDELEYKTGNIYYLLSEEDKECLPLAIYWLKKAVRSGNDKAHYLLAQIYLLELRDEKLKNEALDLLVDSVIKFDIYDGELLLESFYNEGNILRSDYQIKMDTLKNARNNDLESIKSFVYNYNDKTELYKNEVINWAIKLAEDGDLEAEFILLTNDLISGITEEEIIERLLELDSKGFLKSHYLLYVIYNESPKSNNKEKALEYLIKASTHNLEAKTELAIFYGHNKMYRNYKEAYILYKEIATEIKSETDIYKLRRFFTMNRESSRDLTHHDALEEVLTNNIDAALYLGLLYQHGFEVELDYTKALRFYKIAEDAGSIEASKRILLINNNRKSDLFE